MKLRIGDKMNRKRILNAAVATVAACSMCVTPVFATSSTELQQQQNNLEQQKSAAESQVSALQSQLSELIGNIQETQDALISKGQELIQAQADLEAARVQEEKQYEDMKLRIKYMYEEGNHTALEKILSSGSISELLTQADYIQNVHDYDRDMLEQYVETKNQIATLTDTLETEQKNLEALQQEYQTQQASLETTLTDKSAEVANLSEQVQQVAAQVAQKQAEEAAAAEAQRQAEAAAAAQAAQAAAQAAQQQTANNTATNNTTANNTPVADNSAQTTPVVDNTPTETFTPSNNSSAAQTIVSAAYSQLGVPYVWGGTTPYVGLDCSGLTQWCHAQAGISIGRVDSAQLAGGTIVSDPQPGDICWTPGHVAIYIGGGQMIEAQQSGVPICISSVRATYYVRYW